jgi:uncharacterized protein YndB with AHSA1/START domain/uncharacterized protein YciI
MSLPAIRRQTIVPAPPDRAFDVFTQQIGTWWPLTRHSVYGAEATAAFRDGRLIETGPDGDEVEWGTVLAWEPPRLLRLTWHPGYETERASEVEVSFAPVAEALTMVTLTHRDWERFSDPRAARDEYGKGWPEVLGGYAAAVPAAGPPGAGDVWLVLTHTPAPGVGRPTDHPDFAGHPEFLGRLKERGVLVAAGPFPATGEGMTIVRVPAGEAGDLLAQANQDDTSVTRQVLEVRVRPWLVTTTGSSLP